GEVVGGSPVARLHHVQAAATGRCSDAAQLQGGGLTAALIVVDLIVAQRSAATLHEAVHEAAAAAAVSLAAVVEPEGAVRVAGRRSLGGADVRVDRHRSPILVHRDPRLYQHGV